MSLVPYNEASRSRFSREARTVLDELAAAFSRVEIEGPNQNGDQTTWFVQVYRNRVENIPEGFFGSTIAEAATRLASAVGIKIENKDTATENTGS